MKLLGAHFQLTYTVMPSFFESMVGEKENLLFAILVSVVIHTVSYYFVLRNKYSIEGSSITFVLAVKYMHQFHYKSLIHSRHVAPAISYTLTIYHYIAIIIEVDQCHTFKSSVFCCNSGIVTSSVIVTLAAGWSCVIAWSSIVADDTSELSEIKVSVDGGWTTVSLITSLRCRLISFYKYKQYGDVIIRHGPNICQTVRQTGCPVTVRLHRILR